jgi:RNA polymerase sigma-70 factor (ECF subfamily)
VVVHIGWERRGRETRAERLFFLGWDAAAGVFGMMGPEVLGRLVDEHAAALTLYARQWCALPEDVVQEAFLKLVAQVRPPDNPVGWLYRVVRNAAISAARSARRRQHHESRAATQTPAWFTPSETSSLDAEAATNALQALPIEQREVIVAHLWGGLTFAQIGDLAGTSASTVHRWYLAGLSVLRERLGVPCPNRSTTRN